MLILKKIILLVFVAFLLFLGFYVYFFLRHEGNDSAFIVGNSITFYPEGSLEWPGGRGMAASELERDWVHWFSSSTSIKAAEVLNNYPFWIEDSNYTFDRKSFGTYSYLILFLGDNVSPKSIKFEERYNDLILKIGHDNLICISTFWPKPTITLRIKNLCDENGGQFVDVNWIYKFQLIRRKLFLLDTSSAIGMHPDDLSMALIGSYVGLIVLFAIG